MSTGKGSLSGIVPIAPQFIYCDIEKKWFIVADNKKRSKCPQGHRHIITTFDKTIIDSSPSAPPNTPL